MTPLDIAARMDVHARLLAAIGALAEPYRSSVWLHYVEGRTPAEIAQSSGRPVETVRTQIKRGIAQLRDALDADHGGDRQAWALSLAAFAAAGPSATAPTTAAAVGIGMGQVLLAASVVLALTLSVPGSRWIASPTPDPAPASMPGGDPVARSVPATTSGASTPVPASSDRAARQRMEPIPWSEPSADSRSNLEIVEGEFSFHYQQGYSFETQSVVNDLADADLTFESCAGGIASVTLKAPGGTITNLERLGTRIPSVKRAAALARAVVRAETSAFGDREQAGGNDRSPSSDAFLLKTRHGQWASLAIASRAETGGWTTKPISIHYVMSRSTAVFRDGTGDLTVDGVEIDTGVLTRLDREIQDAEERALALRSEPILLRLRELDRFAARLQPEIAARDGADVRVAAVLDREFAAPLGNRAAYIAATYSFEHGTRDDEGATHNDWDFVLQREITVCTVTDDHSEIWDLGELSYADGRSGKVAPAHGTRTHSPIRGHLLAIHTLDDDSDLWTLLRVEATVPGESMVFSYSVLRDPSALLRSLYVADDALQTPEVRMQIRGGAGGGNPHVAALDRSTNGYISSLESSPMEVDGAIDTSERHRAFVSGGLVPLGKVFIIERVE